MKQETLEELIYQAIGLASNEQGILIQALATSNVMKILQERMYSEEELFKLTLDALNLGMTIRQEQLRGYCEKSGNESHKEWFEQFKKK